MNGKIVVPHGMEMAAWDAMDVHAKFHSPAVGCQPGSMCSLDVGLEAALRWLSDNPLRPTGRNIQEISDNLTRQGEGHSTEDYIAEWQRIMFFAPEPGVPSDIQNAIRGKTLTRKQADAIVGLVYQCASPTDSEGLKYKE